MLEDLVAHLVPVGVVDRLEVVEIQEQDRHAEPVAARTCQRQFQMFLEHRAVGQAGEVVVVGHVLHAERGFLGCRDVEHHALDQQGRAVPVADHSGSVVDPHDAAVGADVTVVAGIGSAGSQERLVVRPCAVLVIWMKQLVPDRVTGEEPLGRHPEKLFDVGTHAERRTAEFRSVDVDRPGNLPEERFVGRLRLVCAPFRLAQARLELGCA